MTARQAYRLLGRLLGPNEVGGGRKMNWSRVIASDRVSWERLVEISSRHLVTPALLTAFDERGVIDLIPDDLRQFLDDMRRLNVERNQAISDQTVEIGRALNQEGIEPVLLKGAAHLYSGLYESPGDRVLGDLDVLIPATAARESYLALVKIGYQGYFQTAPGDPYHGHHHLPPLAHDQHRAVVELHTAPVNKRYVGLLGADEMADGASAFELDGARLRRPSLVHQLIQNVLHFMSTAHHVMYYDQRFPLRHLHDLSLIRRTAGDQISWPDIRQRFERAGWGRGLRIQLSLARRYLGQARPPGFRLSPGDLAARAWLLGWSLRR